MTNVYVKNDSNGPLIVGIVIVIVILVLVALWWFLFAGGSGGAPAGTNSPVVPQVTNPLPQGS